MGAGRMISFELAAFSPSQEKNAGSALQLSDQSQGKEDTILLQFCYGGVEICVIRKINNSSFLLKVIIMVPSDFNLYLPMSQFGFELRKSLRKKLLANVFEFL